MISIRVGLGVRFINRRWWYLPRVSRKEGRKKRASSRGMKRGVFPRRRRSRGGFQPSAAVELRAPSRAPPEQRFARRAFPPFAKGIHLTGRLPTMLTQQVAKTTHHFGSSLLFHKHLCRLLLIIILIIWNLNGLVCTGIFKGGWIKFNCFFPVGNKAFSKIMF